MKNIVYLLAFVFWMWSLISKSKKKQEQAAQKQKMATLNKRVILRTETVPKEKPQPKRVPVDVQMQLKKKQAPEPVTDYELAYASTDYVTEEKKVEPQISYEPKTVSQFRKNYGMKSSLGTESSEEKDAYDKDKVIIPKLSVTSGAMKQYVIASEILGKPRALRRR